MAGRVQRPGESDKAFKQRCKDGQRESDKKQKGKKKQQQIAKKARNKNRRESYQQKINLERLLEEQELQARKQQVVSTMSEEQDATGKEFIEAVTKIAIAPNSTAKDRKEARFSIEKQAAMIYTKQLYAKSAEERTNVATRIAAIALEEKRKGANDGAAALKSLVEMTSTVSNASACSIGITTTVRTSHNFVFLLPGWGQEALSSA